MEILARGAFKFTSSDACSAAIDEYEQGGYGALAASDWKLAGAYAFIDTTVELDADMASWRRCFEEVAAAAQEGEVDLRAGGRDAFVRLTKVKGKKKVAAVEVSEGFGEPHQARLKDWGAAVEKIQQSEARARARAQAEREQAERQSSKVLVASFELGGHGRALLVEETGVLALTGQTLSCLTEAGVAWSVQVEAGSLARIDAGTVVAWDDSSGRLVVVRGGRAEVVPLSRALNAPEHEDRARPLDVFPGRPGEVLVREQYSIRRVELATGRQLGELAFGDVPSYRNPPSFEWPRRPVAGRERWGVRLGDGVAFGANTDEAWRVLVLRGDLTTAFELTGPGRLRGLAAQKGKLFGVLSPSGSDARLVPLSKKGPGAPVLTLDSEGSKAVPLSDDEWVLCAGFQARISQGGASHERRLGFVVSVGEGLSPDGSLALADLSYSGKVVVLRDHDVVRQLDAGLTLEGVVWVGEHLVGWAGGLRWWPPGAAAPLKLLGHRGGVAAVRPLGGARFVSLDREGQARFWDLSRSLAG